MCPSEATGSCSRSRVRSCSRASGDIPAISEGALQLADRLTGLLYVEDIEHHFRRLEAFSEPEVFGDEWVAEPVPPPR